MGRRFTLTNADFFPRPSAFIRVPFRIHHIQAHPSLASVSPMSGYLHDVYDVDYPIAIHVEAGIPAGVT